MKLSKKILSAVLCGLIVVGGSQVSLVKANAQTAQWSQCVRVRLHAKGFDCFRDWWTLTLNFKNGELSLNGRTDVPINYTFDDTFILRLKRKDEDRFRTITTFRQCWQADAGMALRNLENIFNNLHIKPGDSISIHGEKYNDSFLFPNSSSIMQQRSRTNYNNYDLGYKSIDRHHTAFLVTERGLEPVSVYETL